MRKRSFLSFLLAMGMLTSATACGGTPPGFASQESYSNDITVLKVFNFDGGIGHEWLENVKTRFEEDYKNYSFEDGKTGVAIEIVRGRGAIRDLLSQGQGDVIFSEEVYYYDSVAEGKILDITDVITSSLSDVTNGAETGSILDKLDPSQQRALTARNDKYYALPHYEIYSGLTYDIDLFTENALYISKTGGWTDDLSEASCGPDGDYSTAYDNGLPSSYEEFYKLMDQMANVGVSPFVFAGSLTKYTNDLLSGLWAAYTGKDEFLLNVNFDSEGTNTKARIMDFSSGTGVEKEVSINMENGYLMSQQSGKYYALKFLENMLSNASYISDRVTGSLSHTGAQENFIYSNFEGYPIGMLIEGSYWYNEAKDHIKRSEATYKEKAKNRKLAWMPLPRQIIGSVQEGEGKKNTLLEILASFAVVNASVGTKEECAKTFLKYCYTDESLVNFTLDTGVPKGVKYTLSEGDLAQLPYYQRSLMEVKAVSDVIYPYSDNPIFINHQNVFAYNLGSKVWESSGIGELVAYEVFKAGGATAEDYFLGSAISQGTWNTQYSKYFG